ncbi:MAG: hypothetical protein EWM73_01169 [Nitrospira sp.]|nr:MAG: hypothetical protein EWM73_01169 [Nitrospira sp.]
MRAGREVPFARRGPTSESGPSMRAVRDLPIPPAKGVCGGENIREEIQRHDGLLGSRNARPQKALLERTQLGIQPSQPPWRGLAL